MKVLYDNDGFIWRDEMKALMVLTGMTEGELAIAMEFGFDGVTFHEAVMIINWFQANHYLIEPIKEFENIRANSMDDMLDKIISLNHSIITSDPSTGFVKAMTYDKGVPYIKFFKLKEEYDETIG